MEDFVNDLIERLAQNVVTGAVTCRDVQERLQIATDAMTLAVSSYEVKKYRNLDSVLYSFDGLLTSLYNKCEWPADFDWWSPSVFSYHLIWNTKDEVLWYQNQFRPPKLGEYVFGWFRITSWSEVMSWKDQPVDQKAFKDFTDAVGISGRAAIVDPRTWRRSRP